MARMYPVELPAAVLNDPRRSAEREQPEALAKALERLPEERFDAIVVDEGQDFMLLDVDSYVERKDFEVVYVGLTRARLPASGGHWREEDHRRAAMIRPGKGDTRCIPHGLPAMIMINDDEGSAES